MYKWDKKLKKLKAVLNPGSNIEEKNLSVGIVEDDFYYEFPTMDLIPSDVYHGIFTICLFVLTFAYLNMIFDNTTSPWDISFMVENRPIYCHKIILSLHSSTFRSTLEKVTEKVLIVDDVPYVLFKELLRFCYNRSVSSNLSEEQLKDMRRLNEKYAVDYLTEVINKKLEKMNQKQSTAQVRL